MQKNRLLSAVVHNVDISHELVVEILAQEVWHRHEKNVPDLNIVSLVARVLGEELLEGDEALEKMVLHRVMEISQGKHARQVTPKKKAFWATRPDAEEPKRRVGSVHSVRQQARMIRRGQLSLLIEEPSVLIMQKDGMVVFP